MQAKSLMQGWANWIFNFFLLQMNWMKLFKNRLAGSYTWKETILNAIKYQLSCRYWMDLRNACKTISKRRKHLWYTSVQIISLNIVLAYYDILKGVSSLLAKLPCSVYRGAVFWGSARHTRGPRRGQRGGRTLGRALQGPDGRLGPLVTRQWRHSSLGGRSMTVTE